MNPPVSIISIVGTPFCLFSRATVPIASPNWIQEKTGLSPATVNTCLRELEQVGIVKEVTGRKRNRVYSYTEYIRILKEGTELPL